MSQGNESVVDKKKQEFRKGDFWISSVILLFWIGLIIFAFLVWLNGWYVDNNFIYHPRLIMPDTKSIINFFYTIGLFSVTACVVAQIYSVFYTIWEVESDYIQYMDSHRENLLNSSKTNVLFFRPVFFPFASGVLAIFFVFLLHGFSANLGRIAIVSIAVGVTVGYFPLKILKMVGKLADAILK